MAKYKSSSKKGDQYIPLNSKEKLTDGKKDFPFNEFEASHFELEIENYGLSFEAVNAEREKFSNLYDYAPVGYFILDSLGIIEEVNQTGVNLLGYNKLTLQNKRFQSFLSPPYREKFYSFLHQMQKANKKVSIEVKLILQNEEVRYTRMEGILIPDTISSSVKYYITTIDITESRQVQKLLKETKERLEMALKACSTGIWNIDGQSHHIILDDYSYQILGLNPGEFKGSLKDFFSLIHPMDQKKVRYQYVNSLHTSLEVDIDFRIVLKNGDIKYISMKGQKIQVSEDHDFFAGIIMDITEKKKLAAEAEDLKLKHQRKILTATIQAQESERFKISRALHDSVCQILYGIQLNLQSIPYYKNNKGEFKSVNQLLDQAIRETREISYELTPSVLKDFGFVAGIKEMACRLSTSEFSIKVNIDHSVDKIDDTIQLYAFRIIQELINNCIKHAHATFAKIIVRQQEELITIIVSDNGDGFKIEPSQALKLGSGLSGIKNQLFLLNGDISVKSTSKGTTIKVIFNKNANSISIA